MNYKHESDESLQVHALELERLLASAADNSITAPQIESRLREVRDEQAAREARRETAGLPPKMPLKPSTVRQIAAHLRAVSRPVSDEQSISSPPMPPATKETTDALIHQCEATVYKMPLLAPKTGRAVDCDPNGLEAQQALDSMHERSRIKELRAVHKRRFLAELIELCRRRGVTVNESDLVVFMGDMDADGRRWQVTAKEIVEWFDRVPNEHTE